MKIKRMTKLLSTFLAVLLFVSAISFTAVFGVSADEESIRIQKKYVLSSYATPEEKLQSMTLILSKFGYELYADEESGEVALVEIANRNNVLFTNPYDIGSATATYKTDGTSYGIKERLLSQVTVKYAESKTAEPKELYSFVEAAMRGQIDLSKIRNGVRMEYTIGREETRKLVPRLIPDESFQSNLIAPMQEAVREGRFSSYDFSFFQNFYMSSDTLTSDKRAQYSALEKDEDLVIWILDETASDKELSKLERFIKDYCADTYSFEQMDLDHEMAGYEAKDEEYPVFKLAIEYTLGETGLDVRISCNGLQYNMANYTLDCISVLPYMGAGNTTQAGYNFYPDGSGSLFDFQQLADKVESVSAKIYGVDFAYHNIKSQGATYQKTIRMPVYGSVATEVIHSYTDAKTGKTVSVSNTVKSLDKILADGYRSDQVETNTYNRGYVAIIEEGESLGRLETYHLGVQAPYATLIPWFNPKPKDSYDISDSISVTSSKTWTVVSNRKYTGNIRIHYQMLTDADNGEKLHDAAVLAGEQYRYYEASWLGMAEAYRDYLIANQTLVKMEESDVTDSIPLYLEVFGAIKTQTTVATIPVSVMTPLTTFANILTMYNQLSKSGVKNINFKLTGFANGGMYSTIPSKLKWEKNVGGSEGFSKLVQWAKKISDEDENANLGIYPDFDFAYSQKDTLTDALNLKKDAVRTIDNRYSSKRIYSATQQTYVSFFQLAISPSRYSKFYTKLMKNYAAYGIDTMSVSTLGNALNSDFDEDDPYNREDSKKFTVNAFEDLSQEYRLMTDSGNAYTWAYVDHIVNADIDSSRYNKSSASVPFLGVVLHGYVQFAGSPLNQEGDPQYTILKSVENGAGMYFILSYQNTSELKEDPYLSRYYSIDYSIWKQDLIAYYKVLNDLLKDVQTSVIVDHKFLNYSNGYQTIRMLDETELRTQINQELQDAETAAVADIQKTETDEVARIVDASVFIRNARKTLEAIIDQMHTQNDDVRVAYLDAIAAFDKYDMLKTSERSAGVSSYRAKVVAALTAYSQLSYYNDLFNETLLKLDSELAILQSELQGSDQEYRYTEAKAIADALKADATLLAKAETEMNVYQNYVPAGKTFTQALEENVAEFNDKTAFDEVETIEFEEVVAEGVYKPETKTGESGTATAVASESTSTFVDNNKVVSVSYGDIDENREKTYFKTFILNYNNFAIRTVYDGQEYTLPAYGYAVIYH